MRQSAVVNWTFCLLVSLTLNFLRPRVWTVVLSRESITVGLYRLRTMGTSRVSTTPMFEFVCEKKSLLCVCKCATDLIILDTCSVTSSVGGSIYSFLDSWKSFYNGARVHRQSWHGYRQPVMDLSGFSIERINISVQVPPYSAFSFSYDNVGSSFYR